MATEIIHNEYPVLTGQASNYYEHRKTALRWIQKLSGKVWTDYNAHDPGVTILEVLSYVLTEVEYKLDFPIEELLSSSNDVSPFELKNNAFYLAEDILTCAPVTKEDYRKLIINGVEGINNAWLIPKKETSNAFDVLLLKKNVLIPSKDVKKAVKKILGINRAIGVPEMKIEIAKFVYISLYADIHIQSTANPDEVLAQIFFNLIEGYLNTNPIRQTFSELEDQGLEYSQIFDGPKMENGIITSEHLTSLFSKITTTEIKKVIASTPGVEMISNLHILEKYWPNQVPPNTDSATSESSTTNESSLRQEFEVPLGFVPFFSPQHKNIKNHIKILKSNKNVGYDPAKVQEIILYLVRKTSRKYELKNHQEVSYNLKANKRKVNDYHSIKHDFPQAYGLIENGFSFIQNFDPIKSRQLKDYLLPYEQIIANTFKALSNLWTRFSIIPLDGEFSHQPLKYEASSPNLEQLNGHHDKNGKTDILIEKADGIKVQYYKRRDAILTHLLARFDVHLHDECEVHIAQNDLEYYQEEIKRKEALLQNIDVLISNRSVFNNNTYEGRSSLEDELYLHLGISNPPAKPYNEAVIPLMDIIKNSKHANENVTAIISNILKSGIDQSNYAIKRPENQKKYSIELKNKDESFSMDIGKKKSEKEALKYLPLFTERFLEISKQSEGFYVIDHAELQLETRDEEFTNFRMSFIFPRWTARFQSESYQQEVERIVAKLIPAHIHGHCFWLGIDEMIDLEHSYSDWFHSKSDNSTDHYENTKKLKGVINNLIVNKRSKGGITSNTDTKI